MTHSYKISDMTCNGCRAQVEQKLNEISGVVKATVNLEEKEASIQMEEHLAIETLQQALPEKYTITPKAEKNIFSDGITNAVTDEKGELQQLIPLFLIFGYISIASVLLNYDPWQTDSFMLDFMGLFYIVFSFFKMLDLKGFPQSFAMYDPLAKIIPAYGWIYPFIETALGILFLMRIQIELALITTIIVLGITTIGVTRSLIGKKTIQCACLGTALKLPMTKATFIENSVMLVMSIYMLITMSV
ncbi:hypothetical protein GCM10022393_23750 [Aquimarina addita]|uniref:HMA domain-containing protein n=1 Tax=Aquimarina addita TaxID=870485 RepID=A0ABP6UKP1_9FLAO